MPQEIVIEPGRTERNYWRDLWRFRELFLFLAWRDILVRYKQTVIGAAWAILRPALATMVFVGFRKVAKMQSTPGIPESILVFSAVLPWQFFSSALTEASNSLIANSNLISKIYFPRLIIPAGAVATSLVDFIITLAILALLMAFNRFAPGWQMILLPFLILLTFALSIGLGLLLAALNVKYRDFRYIVPFIVQFGFFVSPIAIETSSVPERWRLLFSLNPIVGIIDAFRWSILAGKVPFHWDTLQSAIATTVALLFIGVAYFRRTEKTFADVI